MGLPTYNVGTASVSNGNQSVSFAGGAALTGVDPTTGATLAVCGPGDFLIVAGSGGAFGVIQAVVDATHVTLETPWAGSTNATAAYKIYRQSVPLTGSAAALAQTVLNQGSDSQPDLSRTIDSGVARLKARIGSDGLAQLAVGTTGAADASLLAGVEIDPATGAVSMPNGFKAPVVGYRNRLHNGGFNIWQRGTSMTVASGGGNAYTADRWLLVNNASATATISQINAPSGFVGPKALQWTVPSMAAGGSCDVLQRCEGLALQDLDAKAVAVSFDLNAATTGGSLSGLFYIAANTALDNGTFSTLLYQVAFTVPVGSGRVKILVPPTASGLKNGAVFGIRLTQNTSAGTPTVQIGAVQVEKGAVANDYEFRPYAAELAQCLRFAELVGGGSPATSISATQLVVCGRLTPKRASPTISKVSEFSYLAMYAAFAPFTSSGGAVFGTTTTNATEFGVFINGFTGMAATSIGVLQSDSFLASADL